MIKQVSVFLENKPGRLAELTRVLGDWGINMHALMVADTSDFGVVRIICDNPSQAKDLLEQRGFGVSVAEVLAVEVPDRPGGLADLLEALLEGGINVDYAYCFVKPYGGMAVDVFKVEDPKASDILRGAGFHVLGPSELYSSDSA